MGSNNLIRKRRNRAGAMPPLLSASYVPRQTLAERQNPLLVCICPQTRRQSFAVDRLSPLNFFVFNRNPAERVLDLIPIFIFRKSLTAHFEDIELNFFSI